MSFLEISFSIVSPFLYFNWEQGRIAYLWVTLSGNLWTGAKEERWVVFMEIISFSPQVAHIAPADILEVIISHSSSFNSLLSMLML